MAKFYDDNNLDSENEDDQISIVDVSWMESRRDGVKGSLEEILDILSVEMEIN